MATLLPEGKQSFTNSAGVPLVGGKVYTYDAGTSTPRPTYQDAAGTVPNTNPIILDARGEATVFWAGAYKVVLKDAADVTIWTVDNVTDTSAALTAALRSDLAASTGAGLVGWIQSGTGAIFRWVRDKLRENVSAKDFGSVGDGVTNDGPSLLLASNAGAAAACGITLTPGTYLVGANITLAPTIVFAPGAVLKPASGVTITFTKPVSASHVQIFDLSLGGLVALSNPINQDVWAEWWGAKGDNTKTDNQTPINQALTALSVGSAGTVRLGLGTFLTSGVINVPANVRLTGSHDIYTQLKANVATWSGTQMVNATNAGSPMFSSSVECMRISASNISDIVSCIYSDAWQEGCWLKKLLIRDFLWNGFTYETGYGGAATLLLEDLQVWPADASNGANAINMSFVSTQGWMNVSFTRVTVGSGNAAPASMDGIVLNGRIMAICEGIHIEFITNGFILQNGACVVGSGINGGPNTTNALFNCAANWTGNIDTTGTRIGNAAAMIVDSNRSYAAYGAYDVPLGRLVYPPDPTRAIAAGNVLGGATPSFYYQSGFSTTITRGSTGQYTFTLSPTLDASTNYDVQITSLDGAAPVVNASINTGSSFTVTTRNTALAVADCAQFSVKVYRKA